MKIPSTVRQVIYVFIVITSPLMAYLLQQGAVSQFWYGLFTVFVSAVAGLAAINVNTIK